MNGETNEQTLVQKQLRRTTLPLPYPRWGDFRVGMSGCGVDVSMIETVGQLIIILGLYYLAFALGWWARK